MPVIGAGGGLLFGAKTVLPRTFGIPTFVGRTVKAGAGRLRVFGGICWGKPAVRGEG